MAMPKIQRKRSSINFEERIIKRQFSERTLVANKIETSLHLGSTFPTATADQVPSLSPNFEQTQAKESDDSFFLDSRVFEKDSQATKPKADIERERCPEPEIDEFCLSKELEDEHVSFSQTVVDDVPIIPGSTKTTESDQEGDDEPDGLGRYFGRMVKKVADFVVPHHHHHHDNQVDYDLEGFSVHLPAHFHQFDDPCPFGARLRRSEKGYILVEVHRQTAAHKAHLRESDVVTHLNDTELKMMEVNEIQRLFMHIETVFTLTILREFTEGENVHLEKIIIKVTLGDELLVEVVHTEVVWARKPRYVGTSLVSYVFQDADDAPQIYLNATGDRVTMGIYSDERAKFYLDYYAVLGEVPSGQRCVIRNAATNQIYDAVQNNMKTVNNYQMPDTTCMLDRIMRNDESFVFESVQNKGQYLITLGATGAVKLSQYPGLLDVPSEGAFYVTVAKESALSSVRV